jgi:hypothetical protein
MYRHTSVGVSCMASTGLMKASWVALVLTLLHSLLREEGEIGGNCSMGVRLKSTDDREYHTLELYTS